MKRDAISLGIDDDGAKSVRTDLLFALQNLSAVRACSFHRVVKTTFDRKINKRAVLRRLILIAYAVAAHAKTTGRILFFMRQQRVLESAFRHFAHLAA